MIMSAAAAAAAFGNGNDLIVDFVDRRSSYDADKQTSESKMKVKKQVSFSRYVTSYCFQYPDKEEVSKRWHSKKDKTRFMQAMDHDIQILRCRLTTTPVEELEKEILYDCIGLEAHVSSKVMRFLKTSRRENVRSVVKMQHCLNDKQLAEYSMSRSLSSRERAQNIAHGYSVILS
jgi:hypothetical protein